MELVLKKVLDIAIETMLLTEPGEVIKAEHAELLRRFHIHPAQT
jgi:hypothetical protein